MAGEKEVVSIVLDKITEYLKTTPKAAGFLFMSFMSGHIWVAMTVAYRKKTKGNKPLETIHGRAAIGILYFAFILTIFYLIKYKQYDFQYEQAAECLTPTIIWGFAIQFIVSVLFVFLGERR